MKTYDATEAAYKNGFGACADFLRKFRPGDTVDVKTKWGKKRGLITDWIVKDSPPEVLYIVRVGKGDEYMTSTFSDRDIELVSRPFFESHDPGPQECVKAETLSSPIIPFIGLHEDESNETLWLRADTVVSAQDGLVETERGTFWGVAESAEDIMKRISEAWEAVR